MGNITVMSTSATMNYLMSIERLTLKEVRIILGEPLREARLLVSGKRDFTKQNYLDVIFNFPQLVGRIENFENVKG